MILNFVQEVRWPVGVDKCIVLHFGGNNLCIQQLACRAISASVDLLFSAVGQVTGKPASL